MSVLSVLPVAAVVLAPLLLVSRDDFHRDGNRAAIVLDVESRESLRPRVNCVSGPIIVVVMRTFVPRAITSVQLQLASSVPLVAIDWEKERF